MNRRDAVRRNADLIAAVLLAVCCVIVDLAISVTALRVILAVPLCLMLPGYIWTVAIFGRLQRDRAGTLMLVCGLSLVILVLGGLAINETPWGIRSGTWAVLLLVVIAVGAGVSWRRREAAYEEGEVIRAHVPAWKLPTMRPANAVGLVIAVVVAVGAVAASRLPLGAANANGYESLALTAIDHNRAVDLQLTSARQHRASYTVAVMIGTTVVQRKTVSLAPGAGLALKVLVGSSTQTRKVSATAVMTGGKFATRSVYITLGAS